MWTVTLYALCIPPSPMLFRSFETKAEAMRWKDWSQCLPCHSRISRKEQV